MNTRNHIVRAATAWLIGASALAGAFAQTSTGSGSIVPCTDAMTNNGVTGGTLGSSSAQLGGSTAGSATASSGVTAPAGTSAMGNAGSSITTPSTGLTPNVGAAPGTTAAGPNVGNTTAPSLSSSGGTTIAGNSAYGTASLQPGTGCR